MLNVWNAVDWSLMHGTGRKLVCFQDGCMQQLTAVLSPKGTRFLRCQNEVTCDHVFKEAHPVGFLPEGWGGGGGGVMSPEHRWVQERLAYLARHQTEAGTGVAFTATLEHRPTYADVLVEGAPAAPPAADGADRAAPQVRVALEVQRWTTDFAARAAARAQHGVPTTVWFIPEDLTRRGLEGLGELSSTEPVVQYVVRPKAARDGVLKTKPWDGVGDRVPTVTEREELATLDKTVWLYFTVRMAVPAPSFAASHRPPAKTGQASRQEAASPTLRWATFLLKGWQFMDDLLNGSIVWCPAGTPGLPQVVNGTPTGGWVHRTNIADLAIPPVPAAVSTPTTPANVSVPGATGGRSRPAPRATTFSSRPSDAGRRPGARPPQQATSDASPTPAPPALKQEPVATPTSPVQPPSSLLPPPAPAPTRAPELAPADGEGGEKTLEPGWAVPAPPSSVTPNGLERVAMHRPTPSPPREPLRPGRLHWWGRLQRWWRSR